MNIESFNQPTMEEQNQQTHDEIMQYMEFQQHLAISDAPMAFPAYTSHPIKKEDSQENQVSTKSLKKDSDMILYEGEKILVEQPDSKLDENIHE